MLWINTQIETGHLSGAKEGGRQQSPTMAMCITQEIALISSQESYIEVLGIPMQGGIREFI